MNEWMIDAVAVNRDGTTQMGEYDGYGRIGEEDVEDVMEALVFHRACYEICGSPKAIWKEDLAIRFDGQRHRDSSIALHIKSGPSLDAADQGYFFKDGEHDMPKPTSVSDIIANIYTRRTHSILDPDGIFGR